MSALSNKCIKELLSNLYDFKQVGFQLYNFKGMHSTLYNFQRVDSKIIYFQASLFKNYLKIYNFDQVRS